MRACVRVCVCQEARFSVAPVYQKKVQLRQVNSGIITWVCTNSPTAPDTSVTAKAVCACQTGRTRYMTLRNRRRAQSDYSQFHLPQLYISYIIQWVLCMIIAQTGTSIVCLPFLTCRAVLCHTDSSAACFSVFFSWSVLVWHCASYLASPPVKDIVPTSRELASSFNCCTA